MMREIKKIGAPCGLILDRAILDHLGLKEGSKVNISRSGDCVVIRPMEEPASDEAVDAVADEVFQRYGRALTRLAA